MIGLVETIESIEESGKTVIEKLGYEKGIRIILACYFGYEFMCFIDNYKPFWEFLEQNSPAIDIELHNPAYRVCFRKKGSQERYPYEIIF